MNELITQPDDKLQVTSYIGKEWFEQLAEECKAIITEAVFNSRWGLVEGYWKLGERIEHEVRTRPINLIQLFADLQKTISKSTSLFYRAHQAYINYPDIQTLPEGKNITWNKLITKYLPEPKDTLLPPPTLPEGKFRTIVIDPPWPMEFMQLEMRPNQVEMPYPTMSIEEIKSLPVIDKANEDCNLFLWTTHKFLPISFEIMNGWGFEYHVCFTWDKTNGRSLFGFNRRTEFCLYGHRGKITVNQRGNFIDTIFTEKLREHSRKPVIFDDMLRSNTPEPRLEWFSREKKEGFISYGNEVEKYGNE